MSSLKRMNRMLTFTCVLLVIAIAAFQWFAQPIAAEPDQQQDSEAAGVILRMLNGWRIEQGVWALQENAVLDRMALDQAEYVASLPQIPSGGDIHLGRFGEQPSQRALLPPYNWTSYGDAANTAVNEIAYVGASSSAAQRFWENSTVHRNTLLNPAYREVGVAAVPNRFGRLYIVVFGARPNVFPAIADPRSQTLYLSSERYSWARAPYVLNARRVRLFDSQGRPLSDDWLPWSSTMPLPSNVGDHLTVAYEDLNGKMALAEVTVNADLAALVLPEVVVTPTTVSTATPTQVASATPAPTSTQVAATQAASMTPTDSATTASTEKPPVLTATPVATVDQSAADIVLFYDQRSFTLVNNTTAPVNVQEIVFVGQKMSFSVTRWNTQWLSGSLTSLTAGDCLQVWSWQETGTLDKPSACRQRRGVITVAPEQLFWTQSDFTVRWHDTNLATCSATSTRCQFGLP